MPVTDFSSQLEALTAAHLLRRRRVLESPQGAHVCSDGAHYLSFCSNDYLGLANHPRLVAAVADAVALHGVGSGASHLVSGHHALHEALEQRLASYMDRPCLLFSSGYMANVGVIPALVGREDAIFADRLESCLAHRRRTAFARQGQPLSPQRRGALGAAPGSSLRHGAG